MKEFKPTDLAYTFIQGIIVTLCKTVMLTGRLIYFIANSILIHVQPNLD